MLARPTQRYAARTMIIRIPVLIPATANKGLRHSALHCESWTRRLEDSQAPNATLQILGALLRLRLRHMYETLHVAFMWPVKLNRCHRLRTQISCPVSRRCCGVRGD